MNWALAAIIGGSAVIGGCASQAQVDRHERAIQAHNETLTDFAGALVILLDDYDKRERRKTVEYR